MNKRNLVVAVLFAAVNVGAFAGGSATVTCGKEGTGTSFGGFGNGGNDQPVYVNVSYQTSADAGTPGLFWMGIISPDQKEGLVNTQGDWKNYEGGLYPFQSRFDSGLPVTVSISLQLPGGSMSTGIYAGYSLYVGHGAYTTEAREKVAYRRNALIHAKPRLVAAGRWTAEFESDDRYIWSLIQKDMVDNGKFGAVITIPILNCERSSSR